MPPAPPAKTWWNATRRGRLCRDAGTVKQEGLYPRLGHHQAAAIGGRTWEVRYASDVVKLRCMFARKIRVEYEHEGGRSPCLLKWLDSFSMRNFTNATVFDDTLPLGDGVMEIGTRVPLDELKSAMQDWFQRKGYLPKGSVLRVENFA
jgi:hypothetical protein